MNKRGMNLIYGTVIFIVLNVIFFGSLFLFVQRAGDNVILVEQKYAKQISLIVDGAKPGMTVRMDVDEFDEFIDKHGLLERETVVFQEGEVTVKLGRGDGYSMLLVSDLDVEKTFERTQDGKLILNLFTGVGDG
jgi:hypothetical protein